MARSLVVLGVLLARCAAWTPPTAYRVSVLLELPYIDLVEPIEVYYDEALHLQRMDYWDGADTYVFNNSKGKNSTSHQIVPTTTDGKKSEETCFTMTGEHPLQSVFPDLSKFAKAPGTRTVRGVECVVWELSQPELDPKTAMIGNYSFYVDKEDPGAPVSYEFVGHNTITGGHVDEWAFVYSNFVLGPPDPQAFSSPFAKMACEELETDDDDGPTASRGERFNGRAALDDLAAHHPEGAGGRAAAFASFGRAHGRAYDDAEIPSRSALFHSARRYVNAMNRRQLTYRLEANHFADRTDAEKRSLRGTQRRAGPNNADRYHETTFGAVGDVDWRAEGAVTPVKDQGSCGSCWSYGTTGSVEGQHFRKSGHLVELSQQNLMDCSWAQGNNACDGGLDTQAYDWMLAVNGGAVAEAAAYGGYKNADGFCHEAAAGAKIKGYVNVTDGMAGFNDALANVGPLSISIDATPNSFYYYKSGYYYADDCKSGANDLDHTVLAVGTIMDGDQKYTIVKNSWSTHWGMDGYVYISQQNNCCGCATAATYPLMA